MAKKPIAYDAYQQLAEAYDAHIDTKPHNAYYDRPAVLGLMPEDLHGVPVFEAGCGPGAYSAELVRRGAIVTACDVSERMLELAAARVASVGGPGTVRFECVDLEQPLTRFASQHYALVLAPLCLDYIDDWRTLFRQFHRLLRPGGTLVFSCGHPAFDAEYFDTKQYFGVEQVECDWTGFGEVIRMPGYRRSLEEILMPILDAGLIIDHVHEPRPTAQFREADPVRFAQLMQRPAFLCVRATRGPASDDPVRSSASAELSDP